MSFQPSISLGSGYKSILDSLTTAVLVLGNDLTIRYLNPAAESLFETSMTRSQGLPLKDVLLDSADALKTLYAAAGNGQSYTRREAEFALLSGSRLTVDYSVTPISLEPMELLIEIQPRDRLMRISREEDIISQQETTRILVRGMAHEIKNPLGGIRGAAQLLDRELNDEDQREYTRVIIDEADRLRSLVDRMLGPNKALKIAPTNIHEVLERVRTLVEAESKGRVRLKRDYDPSIPEFPGDKEQLIQAFLNIARNAMEAAFENEGATPSDVPPTITFRTRALRQFTIGHRRHRLVCRADIIDNGPGIPADLLQNIFYPMISGRASGTGLGLSITQSIIGQHRGLVECESEPGRTDFIIFLPLEDNQ
ncbi:MULTISPECIES: nitrogen regulation protein NR(II) [Marinobacter]|jgi:two-component system nitrogen regulation sensor histidine kinase GlnL|uniref:Sensory histidine kinase/phosphatase NtrB n=1 Tax=Marinobacter excellens LAMA 842 TaxID=1306954 RepID=A0A137S2J4_9GAMM|nr:MULTISPECIES: nitrogen regulation protein NR(II) [Marinobacter]KXO06641.1 Nitrogen regulation protein NR(II) [Marinobacter excellens LAMA 842]MCD1631075.1 nitrogen regulation protein NR(II) [Marinobacter shengliensis]WBU41954.1 nitrogen regulation protein NR(II) [Marinobacter alkaliphilus]BEH13385.1 PAS domain-containing sensor histidine kinase [Marinobacter shengliensis]